MKKAFALALVLFGATQTLACSDGAGGETAAQSTSQGLVTVVPAGAKSRAAGVAQWNLTHGSGKVTATALGPDKTALVHFDIRTTHDLATKTPGVRVDTAGGVFVVAKGTITTNTLA